VHRWLAIVFVALVDVAGTLALFLAALFIANWLTFLVHQHAR